MTRETAPARSEDGRSIALGLIADGQRRMGEVVRPPIILQQRDAAPSYDVYVARSMAEYLWGWLGDAGARYGIAVVEG